MIEKIERRPRKPRVNPNDKVGVIVAQWRTGEFTQRELAYTHGVSQPFVAKHTKGVAQDAKSTIIKLVEGKQELANFNVQTVIAVNAVVDEKTKHIAFFNKAAITNVEGAMQTPCENQNDFKARAETISKAGVTLYHETEVRL